MSRDVAAYQRERYKRLREEAGLKYTPREEGGGAVSRVFSETKRKDEVERNEYSKRYDKASAFMKVLFDETVVDTEEGRACMKASTKNGVPLKLLKVKELFATKAGNQIIEQYTRAVGKGALGEHLTEEEQRMLYRGEHEENIYGLL